MDIKNINQRAYDYLAPKYEEKADMVYKDKMDTVKQFTKFIKTGKRVLDLGCGVGIDSSIFNQLGYQTTCLDISEQMAKFAKLRNPDSEIIVGDFEKIKFEHNFDGIFAQAFIHLFPKKDVQNIIKKIKESLVYGGVAYISTTISDTSREGIFRKNSFKNKLPRFRRFWTKKELREAINLSGMEIIDQYDTTCVRDKKWMIFITKNQ